MRQDVGSVVQIFSLWCLFKLLGKCLHIIANYNTTTHISVLTHCHCNCHAIFAFPFRLLVSCMGVLSRLLHILMPGFICVPILLWHRIERIIKYISSVPESEEQALHSQHAPQGACLSQNGCPVVVTVSGALTRSSPQTGYG